MIFRINSSSSADTLAAGKRLGEKCKGGELFLLTSDLGGGKTTFTKGLAEGLGSTDQVSSPTFTVNKIYHCRDGLELHHFDFYRLQDAGIVGLELAEILGDPAIVTVVEWGDIVTEQLPADRITVKFDRTAESEDSRHITIEIPEKYAYLREGER